jgi:hypothetical protein
MAALTTEAVLVGSVDTPDGFIVDVWNVQLSGAASDTFTVPGVATTAGVGILLKGTVAAIAEGNSTVTVTNSANPRRRNQVIICTLRQRGGLNNASIDEDPT